jgi:hypothetical protein
LGSSSDNEANDAMKVLCSQPRNKEMCILLRAARKCSSLVFDKNYVKKKEKSATYLAADRRHRRSTQIVMKVDKVCSFQSALGPSSAEEED